MLRFPWDYAKDGQDEKRTAGEDKMLAPAMTKILSDSLVANGFLVTTERSQGYYDRPLDLMAGDEKDLEIIGFEVKSDGDTYVRLKDQLNTYSDMCKSVYLVLHKKAAPEWLPDWVGVIRVSTDGTGWVESTPSNRDILNITTNYDWDQMLIQNGLKIKTSDVRDALRDVLAIRDNLLFNRFFGAKGWESHDAKKFWPLTESQKRLVVGFDVPAHFARLKKDANILEKRLKVFQEILNAGQKKLE